MKGKKWHKCTFRGMKEGVTDEERIQAARKIIEGGSAAHEQAVSTLSRLQRRGKHLEIAFVILAVLVYVYKRLYVDVDYGKYAAIRLEQ